MNLAWTLKTISYSSSPPPHTHTLTLNSFLSDINGNNVDQLPKARTATSFGHLKSLQSCSKCESIDSCLLSAVSLVPLLE